MFPDISGLALVFEYMPETLYSRMKQEENPVNRRERRNFMRMLLKGLKYLHDLNIMHRVSDGILHIKQLHNIRMTLVLVTKKR